MKRMKLNIQLFKAIGTIEFPANHNLQGKIDWYANGNTSTNESSVSCHLYARRTAGYTYGPDWTGSIAIDETTYNFTGFNHSVRIETDWVLITSYYKNVKHDASGNKKITISGSITGPSGTTLAGVTSSGSGTAVLDTLHRAPDITWSITEHDNYLIKMAGIPDNVFVENLSIKYVTLAFTTYDSATISDRTVYNGSQAYTTALLSPPNTFMLDFGNNTLQKNSNNTKVPISVTATDSLGGSNTVSAEYDFIPYIIPSIVTTSSFLKRNGQLSGLVNLNVTANFYHGDIGYVNNYPTIKYKFWENGTTEPADTSYITINSSHYKISGNTVTISNYEIGSTTPTDTNYFDYNKKYNVKLLIQDCFKSATATIYIIKGKAVWSEYKDRVDFVNITMGGLDIFPLGYILLTTDSSFNPNGYYKGTWEKLTADAYFKIVTSSAGSLGGTSSEHKIPISSIPPHTHQYGAGSPYRANDGSMHYTADTTHNPVATTSSTGGGQAYYPYYYGVIAWHRTA